MKETRGGKPKTQGPWILSPNRNRCPSLSLRPSGGGVRIAREAAPHHPLPFAFSAGFHLPLAAPPPLPRRISSAFFFAAARGGVLSATPIRVARHLPQANFVHFCVSLLCKFERWEGSETYSSLTASLSLDVPGVRSHLQLLPEREKVPGNKSRDTPPSLARGAVAGAALVCAPPKLPPDSLALRVCPGGGWGAAGAAPAKPRGPLASHPHHLQGLLILCRAVKSLGKWGVRWKGQWRVVGRHELSPPVHQRRRLSD